MSRDGIGLCLEAGDRRCSDAITAGNTVDRGDFSSVADGEMYRDIGNRFRIGIGDFGGDLVGCGTVGNGILSGCQIALRNSWR